jgi:DNA-binding XRE family transcriptional regulator
MVITATQCRAARALVDWSQSELAENAGLTQVTLSTFEKGGNMRESNNLKIQETFEGAGVEFIGEDEASNAGGAGVRLKKG